MSATNMFATQIEMAPYKTLSHKEQNLIQRPWISSDILAEMNCRDELHKKYFLSEKNKEIKLLFFPDYKKKHNSVLSLIKKSCDEYFKIFFDSHKNDIRKIWQGIKKSRQY